MHEVVKATKGIAMREYNNKRIGSNPWPILVEAINMLQEKNSALDLGAGAMVETRYMVESGFQRVVAVDEMQCDSFLHNEKLQHITFICKMVEDYEFPVESFDLVSALFVLPFLKKSKLPRVTEGIRGSLKEGGIFVGTFFGPEDYRARNPKISALEEKDVIKQLLFNFDVISNIEKKGKKETDELFHVFWFIARKVI